jgi:hypothetical protein
MYLNMMTIPHDQDLRAARFQITRTRIGSLEANKGLSQAGNTGERLREGQVKRGGRHNPSGL